MIVVDEATREMIVREITDIWWPFGLALVLIFQWFIAVQTFPQFVKRYPRWAKLDLWIDGIITSVLVLPLCFMNELFGEPNPLYPWMRVFIGLAYLAVWGYIIKRRSEIQSPRLSKSQ
ncbi:MAG: hypothetical protein NZ930_02885 [Candidatus Bipolaricaulota bacterium]|nr:hypothetical protein [Candidatus Bipolaricaulota bacterium]MDW8030768.1 hypothetical protein [Candidatus Bipolaricaulota bacterium]